MRKASTAVAASLLISLLFIASYVGALHAPTARHVPLAVSAQVPNPVLSRLEASEALEVKRVADADAAAARSTSGEPTDR